MAVLEIIAKNLTGSAVTFTELDVPQTQIAASASYALSNTNRTLDIIANEELYNFVDTDKIELTVSSTALTKVQALAFLRLEFSINFDFGNADFSGTICYSGIISPAQITSDQAQYDPPGLATATGLFLTSSKKVKIKGLKKPDPLCRKVLPIVNKGNKDIELKNNDGGATEDDDKMLIGKNRKLKPGYGITLIYDTDSMRYRTASDSH